MSRAEPIAIVGAACRFPGAATLAEYWHLLRRGGSAFESRPADSRAANRPSAGPAPAVRAGFLTDIDAFDAAFFKISDEEAIELDPQQRLLVETAWQALESASLPQRRRWLSVGTFIGVTGSEYGAAMARSSRVVGPFSGTGTLPGMAAGRVAYALDLHGPCVAVDTACSSSLSAVHLACQSLASGECDVAVAGGANALVDPVAHEYLRAIGALSPTACRPFDNGADGYLRGEGVGVVVLRRLPDALAARHAVLAVIRGSAMNHDGKSNGLTAPNGEAQTAVIRQAIARAGIEASDIGYLEAHGTGTRLGDPVELRAIGEGYASSGRRDPLLIGSVKANIGHLEAAAGIASLIKVALALSHQSIPPQVAFERENVLAPWREARLEVARTLRPWPGGGRALAAVSSFGFTGTNVHLVLEEHARSRESAETDAETFPILLSGRSARRVTELAEELAGALSAMDTWRVGDVAFTLATRSHSTWRTAFAVRHREELEARLRDVAAGRAPIVDSSRPADLGSDDKDVCARYLRGSAGDADALFDANAFHSESLPVARLEPRSYWFTSLSAAGATEKRGPSAAECLSLMVSAMAGEPGWHLRRVTSFRLSREVAAPASGLSVRFEEVAPDRLRLDVIDGGSSLTPPIPLATAEAVIDRHGT